MAETIGSIQVVATINTKGYDDGKKHIESGNKDLEKQAKKTSDAVENGLNKTSKSSLGATDVFSGLTGKLVGFAAAATAAIGVSNLLGSSLSDLAGLQTARSGFEVLTGSAEKASQVMQEIGKYANTTPFEFPEIAKSAKTLLGFGVDAKDVQVDIENLGNAVAASGGDFSNVSRVFGQIFAAGKVNAEDFNQLIDNGIALGPEISKQLGIPMSQLKDNIAAGNVTFDVFNKALQSASKEGGKYFGATAKLSDTLNGRISTLKDTFTGFVGKAVGVDFGTGIVAADGAFAKFSDTIKAVTDALSSPEVVASVGMIGTAIQSAFKIANDAISQTIKFLQPVFDYIKNNQTLWDVLKTSLQVIAGIILGLIIIIGVGLVGAFAAVGAIIDFVKSIVDNIIGGFISFIGIIQSTITAIVDFGSTISKVMSDSYNTINNLFGNIGQWFSDRFNSAANAVRAAFSGIGSFFSGVFNTIRNIFGDVGTAIGNSISNSFRNVINGVLRFAANTINGFIDSINNAINVINNIPGVSIGNIGRMPIAGFETGGFTGTGASNEIAGVVHRGEYVIPKAMVDQSTGMPNIGGNTTINLNLSGIMTSSPSEERALARRLVDRLNEQLRANGKTELAI